MKIVREDEKEFVITEDGKEVVLLEDENGDIVIYVETIDNNDSYSNNFQYFTFSASKNSPYYSLFLSTLRKFGNRQNGLLPVDSCNSYLSRDYDNPIVNYFDIRKNNKQIELEFGIRTIRNFPNEIYCDPEIQIPITSKYYPVAKKILDGLDKLALEKNQ